MAKHDPEGHPNKWGWERAEFNPAFYCGNVIYGPFLLAGMALQSLFDELQRRSMAKAQAKQQQLEAVRARGDSYFNEREKRLVSLEVSPWVATLTHNPTVDEVDDYQQAVTQELAQELEIPQERARQIVETARLEAAYKIR